MTTITTPITPVQAASAAPTPLTPSADSVTAPGITFRDVMDAINPLQHIPILSSLYRAATNTSISSGSQIVGDTAYGGVFGVASAITSFASSVVNAVVKKTTGEDISEHVMATVESATSPSPPSPTTALAANDPAITAAVMAQAARTAPPAAPTVAQQVNTALNTIYNGQNTTVSNASYQRAQMYDALHKNMMKISA